MDPINTPADVRYVLEPQPFLLWIAEAMFFFGAIPLKTKPSSTLEPTLNRFNIILLPLPLGLSRRACSCLAGKRKGTCPPPSSSVGDRHPDTPPSKLVD